MTHNCSVIPCEHPQPASGMFYFKLNEFPKHLRKPLKLLFKQYVILGIEMCDDSVFCETERIGKLITRNNKYAIIRYADNYNHAFEWRINEDEFINN